MASGKTSASPSENRANGCRSRRQPAKLEQLQLDIRPVNATIYPITLMKRPFLLTTLSAIAIAHPLPVLAHAVSTEYLIPFPAAANGEETEIQLKSTYSNGQPMAGAAVAIYSPNDWSEPWLVGEMDEHGQFAFTPDTEQPGNWEVTIRQDGHGDMLTIPVQSEGIDVAQVQQGPKQDNHYAVLPLGAVVTLGLIGAAGLYGAVRWRFAQR